MDVTDKSAQPSMEEILASIRKLLSEESGQRDQEIDFNARPILLNEDEEHETSDFDLPAIFRSSPAASDKARSERTTASLVRLTDAIRSVAGGAGAGDLEALSHRVESEPKFGLSALKTDVAQSADVSPMRELQLAGAAVSAAASASAPAASDRLDDGSFFESAQAASAPAPTPEPAAVRDVVATSDTFRVTASSEPRDVQRVMAPFKDTKFMSLSTQPAQAAPAAVEQKVQAAVAAPTPVEPPHKPAFVEPELPDLHAVKREPVLPAFPPRSDIKQSLSSAFPQAASAHREVSLRPADIEEASADLLRPMLRSWLAENMPKMVEKALVLEMQQQLGSMKKSGSSES